MTRILIRVYRTAGAVSSRSYLPTHRTPRRWSSTTTTSNLNLVTQHIDPIYYEMIEPSALIYARHYDLTKDYTQNDILSSLGQIRSPGSTLPAKGVVGDQRRQLLEYFSLAAQNYTSLASDTNGCESPNVSEFLKTCISYQKPDHSQIYDENLPDPLRFQKLKLILPLLLIGGGNVRNDVSRIRKGIDLDGVLDEVLEDWKDIDARKKPRKLKAADSILDDLQKMICKQVEKQVKDVSLEVSAPMVKYLEASLSMTINANTRLLMIGHTLSDSRRIPYPDGSLPRIRDWDLDEDDEEGTNVPTTNEAVAYPAVKQEILHQNVLLRLDTADEPEAKQRPYLGESDTDANIEDSSKQYTNRDRAIIPATMEVDVGTEVVCITPRKKDRGEHSSSPLGNHAIENAEGQTQRCSHHVRKVDVPRLVRPDYTLPPVRLEALSHLLSQIVEPREVTLSGSYPMSVDLPIKLLTMQEVLEKPGPVNEGSLEKFLGKAKAIVTSDQLLWKEPGLRLLEQDQEEAQDLCFDDLDFEQQDGGIQSETPKDATFQHMKNVNPESEPDVYAESELLIEVKDFASPASEDAHKPLVEFHEVIRMPKTCRKDLSERAPRLHSDPFDQTSKPPARSSDGRRVTIPTGSQRPQQLRGLYDTAKAVKWLNPDKLKLSTQSTSFSDSLSGFLDLKGKQFKPLPVQRISKTEYTLEDPIELSQCSSAESMQICHKEDNSSQNLPPSSQVLVLPDLTPSGTNRAIVLNYEVLEHKPLLARFLECQKPQDLTLIYRNLGSSYGKGPDIILNSMTCLFITNMQALGQRPLPGQNTSTGLSAVHDQITNLAASYRRTLLLVHYVTSTDAEAVAKTTYAQAELASFCSTLSRDLNDESYQVLPVWLPCDTASSTPELVNRWTWHAVLSHAYTTSSAATKCSQFQPSASPGTALIEDETVWEMLLVKAGLNPMAAQIVLTTLKRPGMPSGTPAGSDSDWGLRRLVAMRPEERHVRFDELIGRRAVHSLSRALQGGL